MEDEDLDFTMGDLLQELATEFGAPASTEQSYDGVYTTGEIANLFGVSRSKALKEVKRLHIEGRIEISQKRIDRFGGGEVVVPAYRLIEPKEKSNEQD